VTFSLNSNNHKNRTVERYHHLRRPLHQMRPREGVVRPRRPRLIIPTMSLFTWLDYSEKERRRMTDLVDVFREKDTRDELGLASVRDSFSDQLFPGTSTIQTRARYFLLVPWTYQRLEKQGKRPTPITDRARNAEVSLTDAIERSDDNEGNFGKHAGNTLKRLPSSVYWQGLGVWGIRDFQGSITQYHSSFFHHQKHRQTHLARAQERDEEHDDLLKTNWHGGLPEPPAEFPKECSLSLSRDEAEYLRERIRFSSQCRRSLMAELVAPPLRTPDLEFIWEHPRSASFGPAHKQILTHAQNFSEMMHGAALLYNLILSEEVGIDDWVEDYSLRMEEWAQAMDQRAGTFTRWNQNEFRAQAEESNHRIKDTTMDFINGWWDLTLSTGAASLASSPVARKLITLRERQIKPPNLVRIGNPRARDSWSGSSGTGRMDFRWAKVRRILSDIFDGLEADDA